jgi:hypothetical protein
MIDVTNSACQLSLLHNPNGAGCNSNLGDKASPKTLNENTHPHKMFNLLKPVLKPGRA